MRLLGLLTVAVLVLCFFTYFTRQPISSPPNNLQPGGSDAQRYASAIKAARGAVENSEAGRRRNFVLEMRLANSESAGAIEAAENPVYSVEGEDSEILVVTSNAMENGRCSRFAAGEYGGAAGSAGFTELVCRNRISRSEYNVSLDRGR